MIINKLEKEFKDVFNTAKLIGFIIGSYSNNTQREDSDINLHIYTDIYHINKVLKLLTLFKVSLPKEISIKLDVKVFSLDSLTTSKNSITSIEFFSRLYQDAKVLKNDFKVDLSQFRRPNFQSHYVINQIWTLYSYSKFNQILDRSSLSIKQAALKYPSKYVDLILNTIFITKSSASITPHTKNELISAIQSIYHGTQNIFTNFLNSPTSKTYSDLESFYNELYIKPIFNEYILDNIPKEKDLMPYQLINSTDRPHLLLGYANLEISHDKDNKEQFLIPDIYSQTYELSQSCLKNIKKFFT